MKYKIEDIVNKVHCADCLEFMKEIPDNSVDTIITDPPYGLGFMGKDWDTFKRDQFGRKGDEGENDLKVKKNFNILPRYNKGIKASYNLQEFTQQWATQALRVAKPGATLMCFGGTRTFHRIACGIEDAGWDIFDTMMWLYGSGFPKALDISKQLQKKSGKKAKIIGRNPNSREKCDKSNTLYESGTVGKTDYITEPTDKNAMLWNGWKSHGLKPAWEPIILAKKSNDGSYANNALKHGVSGLNIDGGRIGFGNETDKRVGTKRVRGDKKGLDSASIFGQTKEGVQMYKDKGRFPANLILSHTPDCIETKEKVLVKGQQGGNRTRTFGQEGKVKSGGEGTGGKMKVPDSYVNKWICSEDCPVRMLDEQSGEGKSTDRVRYNNQSKFSGKGIYGKFQDKDTGGFSDKGGASRFFYCAKSSKSERNMGCEGMENSEPAYKSHRPNYKNTKGIETPYAGTGRGGKEFKNNHPTVKPLELMKYLCTLTKTPTQRTCNDCGFVIGLGYETNTQERHKENKGLPKVPEKVSSNEGRRKIREHILQQKMQFKLDGKTSQDNKGLDNDGQGIQVDINAESPESKKIRVYDGTQVSDGKRIREVSERQRGSSSQKWDKGRQQGGKLSSNEKVVARQEKENKKDDNNLSALPENNKDIKCCPKCGGSIRIHNGCVLDPFLGSGTTAMACKATGRDFIGIEKDPEYCKIAEARIRAVQKPLL